MAARQRRRPAAVEFATHKKATRFQFGLVYYLDPLSGPNSSELAVCQPLWFKLDSKDSEHVTVAAVEKR